MTALFFYAGIIFNSSTLVLIHILWSSFFLQFLNCSLIKIVQIALFFWHNCQFFHSGIYSYSLELYLICQIRKHICSISKIICSDCTKCRHDFQLLFSGSNSYFVELHLFRFLNIYVLFQKHICSDCTVSLLA